MSELHAVDKILFGRFNVKCMNDRVTSKYLWPFKEDVIRFDFEVDGEGGDIVLPIDSWVKG